MLRTLIPAIVRPPTSVIMVVIEPPTSIAVSRSLIELTSSLERRFSISLSSVPSKPGNWSPLELFVFSQLLKSFLLNSIRLSAILLGAILLIRSPALLARYFKSSMTIKDSPFKSSTNCLRFLLISAAALNAFPHVLGSTMRAVLIWASVSPTVDSTIPDKKPVATERINPVLTDPSKSLSKLISPSKGSSPQSSSKLLAIKNSLNR